MINHSALTVEAPLAPNRTPKKGYNRMSTYSITTLLRLWKQNEVTAEQAVGHTIQHIATLTEQIAALEKRIRHLETAPLDSHPGTRKPHA